MKIYVKIPSGHRSKIDTDLILEHPLTKQKQKITVYYDPEGASSPDTGKTRPVNVSFGFSDIVLIVIIVIIFVCLLFMIKTEKTHGKF
jgi:hypothetical protein